MLQSNLKIRIVVPMPCDVVLSKGTERCIDNLIKAHPEIEFQVFPVYGAIIAANRITGIDYDNGIDNFDMFLCVDNRKIFTVNDFDLLFSMNQNLASGWYLIAGKYASFFGYDNDEKEIYLTDCIKENKIVETDCFGTGFYLVKNTVYKKMKSAGIVDYYFYPKRAGKFTGEDVGFCDNLKLINEKIYINKNVFIEREPLPFLTKGHSMTRRDIVTIGNVVSLMKSLKKPDWELSIFLLGFWCKLKAVYDEIGEYEKTMQERRQELILQHCAKDKEDKPVIINHVDGAGNVVQQSYAGLMLGQCPEYDAAIKGINNELKKYLDEEVSIDLSAVKKLPFGKFPKNREELDTNIVGVMLPYLDGVEGVL